MHGNKRDGVPGMMPGEMTMPGGMQGEGMQGMMGPPDPASIDDRAETIAQADKLAEHLEMMRKMLPKLQAQVEALRRRADELSSEQS